VFDASQIFRPEGGFDLRRIVKISKTPQIVAALEPLIVHEDNHLLVVFKPAGWLSQKDNTNDESVNELFGAYLRRKYAKPGNVFCAAVHRLDRPASGLLVLARTSKAAARLSEQIRQQRFEKRYRVLTQIPLAVTTPGAKRIVLSASMRKVGRIAKRTPTAESKNSGDSLYMLTATLTREVQKTFEYEVTMEGGKFHQIRALFAAHGSPILGDIKYTGKKLEKHSDRLALMCTWLNFEHPTQGKPIIATLTPNSLKNLHTYFI
jgi:23S rRNA pseudouridine1911/1915/1917 synthase